MLQFEELIKKLCLDYGIEVTPNQTLYSFEVDDEITISLEQSPHDPKYYTLYTTLDIENAKKTSKELHQLLLERNLFGLSTEGGAFSLDSSHDNVVFYRRFHQNECDYKTFLSRMGNWLEAIRLALKDIQDLDTPAADSSGAPQKGGQGGPWMKI